MHTSNDQIWKRDKNQQFFLNTFLSLMYLQALFCSVSLKYYKHFSDLGRLDLFTVFFLLLLFCSLTFDFVLPVLSTDNLASHLKCAPVPLVRHMHIINVEQAKAEGNTLRLLADNLWPQTPHTINYFCASTSLVTWLPLHPKVSLFLHCFKPNSEESREAIHFNIIIVL